VDEGDSPIIPVIFGDELAALRASERLADRGYLVAVVRPPTVPRGTSRLRITVTSDHTEGEISGLVQSLA
jgi:7-keto-8-aminopelargonate synthetase-like enzyme